MITRRQLTYGATAVAALGVIGALGSLGVFDSHDGSIRTAEAQPISMLELEAKGPLDDIVLGAATAPVTIIEYASMTCPHCAHFSTETFPKLKEKYIDTGKVRYIMREFPLNQPAVAASMAIRCAGPDAYYPLTETLFAEQRKWLVEDNFLDHLYDIVKQAGLTRARFQECLSDRSMVARIQESRDRAEKKFKVNSTPSFFINGTKYAGTMTIAELDRALEPFLKKDEPATGAEQAKP
jgi:protein-disulfide isomerase